MIDSNGVAEYDYDQIGRRTWVSDYTEEAVGNEYDESGNKMKVFYSDG